MKKILPLLFALTLPAAYAAFNAPFTLGEQNCERVLLSNYSGGRYDGNTRAFVCSVKVGRAQVCLITSELTDKTASVDCGFYREVVNAPKIFR